MSSIGNLSSDPIFILGIMERSGTNFLSDLISAHPSCHKSFVAEDFLTKHAHLLKGYVDAVFNNWSHRWLVRKIRSNELLGQCLGEGLVSFLSANVPESDEVENVHTLDIPIQISSKRLVSKTPSVDGLEYFFDFFPTAYLIILVRDGRAVTESMMKTFGRKYGSRYEEIIKEWTVAAKQILSFQESHQANQSRFIIVRYEDLITDRELELKKIFAFLKLDSSIYDYKSAEILPVKGSSMVPKDQRLDTWKKPIQATSNFSPLERFSDWNVALHERFNWIAGSHLESFNYEPLRLSKNISYWKVRNILIDLVEVLTCSPRLMFRRAGSRIKRLFRELA